MEEKSYEIQKVYLVGGCREQTEEMTKNEDIPINFRKEQIRRYSDYLPYAINEVVSLNQKIANGTREEGRTEDPVKKITDTKLRLAIANAALNFYNGDNRAQGFGGLQIKLANGNTVLIHSGFFDNQQDCIIENDSIGNRIPKPNIERILAELAAVSTATHSLSISHKDGSSSFVDAEIPYVQPEEMKDIVVETKEDYVVEK